jgi:hypothetical protein
LSKVFEYYERDRFCCVSDCIICFFEKSGGGGGGAAGDSAAAMMQQMARELYGVPHSAVYIWQYSSHDSCDATLTHKHMLYFLKDISKALRSVPHQSSINGHRLRR